MLKSKKATQIEIVIFKNHGSTRRQSMNEMSCYTCSRRTCTGCQAWDMSREVPKYIDKESINGEVVLSSIKEGFTFRNIKAYFIGELSGTYKSKKINLVFTCECRDLHCRDHVASRSSYKFSFSGEAMTPYETYSGSHLQVRYYVQAILFKRFGGKITTTQDVIIERPSFKQEVTRNFKMEAGNERSLQFEMECNKWRYHQNDVIEGAIRFIRLDIELKKVELQIILKEKEIVEGREKTFSDMIIWNQEILDGSPLDNGPFPIRVYLTPLSICPTAKNLEDRFCVKYYLKLNITDTSDNVFYKLQELVIFRKMHIPLVSYRHLARSDNHKSLISK